VRARLVLPLLLTVVLAGCGGGGGTTQTTRTTPAAPSTPLARALVPVLDGPVARAGLRYSDEAALRRLAHAPRSVTQLGTTQLDQRWFGLIGFGAPAFVTAAPQLQPLTGIDLFAADTAVTAGQGTRTVTRLDGARLATAAIEAALRRLGARASAGTLAIGRDGAVHVSGPLGRIGVVSALNRVVARPGTLVTGAYDDTLPAVLGGGRSIAADPEWAAAIRCLGDVVAASITPKGGHLVAVGVVRPAPHPRAVTGRICRIDGRVRSQTITLPPAAAATQVFDRLG
jgi:hypothetical protein